MEGPDRKQLQRRMKLGLREGRSRIWYSAFWKPVKEETDPNINTEKFHPYILIKRHNVIHSFISKISLSDY